MKYDFDRVIDRRGTCSWKWDSLKDDPAVIPMMLADMDLPSPEPVAEAMRRVADRRIYGYTRETLEPEFAASLCRWFRKYHRWEIAPEETVISLGTFGALERGVKMFAREGEGVILMPPVYGHFMSAVEDEWKRKAVFNHLINDGSGYYTIDFDDLEEKCADPHNKVLIFCSPANPVGRVWTEEEIRKVIDICRKHGVFLISDEVHCDHLRRGVRHIPTLSLAEDQSSVMAIVGVNKSFNMAGLSCANAVIQDLALRKAFLKGYSRPLPNPFAVEGQIAAYNEGREWMDQVCEYIEGNIDEAIAFFRRELPKVKIRKPEGTYFLWLDFRPLGLSDREIHHRIYEEAKVLLQDGTVHDPERGQCFQRMCVPCPRSLLLTACERIADAFRDVR